MCASLNIEGYVPDEGDLLKSIDRGLAIKSAVIFNNFTGMLSGPGDLLRLRAFNNAGTSCSFVLIVSRVGAAVELSELIGGWYESGIFTVDWRTK